MDDNCTELMVQSPQETALVKASDFNLDDKEELFCELFINGGALFAGNAEKCYLEAFGTQEPHPAIRATHLLQRNEIQGYMNVIDVDDPNEAHHLKKFLTANLMAIIEETSTGSFENRFGETQSPAPLRAVAVAASKTLADLHSLRKAPYDKDEDNREKGSNSNRGVTFNVVVPVAQASPDSNPTIVIQEKR